MTPKQQVLIVVDYKTHKNLVSQEPQDQLLPEQRGKQKKKLKLPRKRPKMHEEELVI